MTKRIVLLALTAFTVFACINACKHDPFKGAVNQQYGGFPDAVGKIFIDRCATAGCHNAASYTASGGLLLDSWEHLFDGGNNGAVAIPYSPEFSSLMNFINTDSTQGPITEPRMPNDGSPALTKDEYNAIRNWLAAGAPDRNGNIPFADNAETRQKIYLTQQGCDLVAVIDAQKKVVMRYIKVGVVEGGVAEAPHCIRVSADGKYAYVCFIAGSYLQKINTTTDKVESQIKLNATTSIPSWNILFLTPDNNHVIVCDYNVGGGATMQNANSLAFENFFNGMDLPHGVASPAGFDTLYFGSQKGNTIYKRPAKYADVSLIKKISLDNNPPVTAQFPGSPDPHEIVLTPDGSRLMITCQGSNEVKIMDVHTSAIIKTFTTSDGVGKYPQEIAISRKNRLAYISCQDLNGSAFFKGSVFIFDYETLQVKGNISGSFSQPHGIIVDDMNDVLYVASINADGPAPHHATACGGRSGYYQVFSSIYPFAQLNTRKYEVTVAPYSADVRFKN